MSEPFRKMSNDIGTAEGSEGNYESQQSGPRSRSPSRRRRTSSSVRNTNRPASGAGERSTHSNSRSTSNSMPQNTTNDQTYRTENQSRHMSPAYATGATIYPDQSNIPTTSPAVRSNSINEPAPSSWQGYFPDMHLQMYSSPMSIAYQNLATPMMQPRRGNSLPTPQVAYPATPMHASQPMPPSQSVPQSYHTLPDSMGPALTPGRMIQSGLPTAQLHEFKPNSAPVVPINPYPMQPVTETKKDAFVASDPYHPQKPSQGAKEISSFDEVEMPGPPRWGYSAPANTSLGHPTQASAYVYAGGRPQDMPGSTSQPPTLSAKEGKDIKSFDEIETPGPSQNPGSIVQGFTPVYGTQVASYGWPNGHVSDKPGSVMYPSEQDAAWGVPAPSGPYAPAAWRTAPSYAQRKSTYEGSNLNTNAQNQPTLALDQGELDRYASYPTGYSTTPSLAYTSPPTVQTNGSGWSTPSAWTKVKVDDDPSSRISSWGEWGTHAGRPSATSYSTPYGTPAIPSPSGWGSEYEADADYSPSVPQTRRDEHNDLEGYYKARIKMPEPYIPQILPSRRASSLKTPVSMSELHIPQIIPFDRRSPSPALPDPPNVGEKTSIIPSPVGHTSVSIQTSPIGDAPEERVSSDSELSPIQPNEEPSVNTPPMDSPTSYRNELSVVPVPIPGRASSDEHLSPLNENVMQVIGVDNEENTPISDMPTRTPSSLPVPPRVTITMPIPQIPLIVPPRRYNATWPDPPDLPAPQNAPKHSSSESISKPEPSSPAKSSFSSWSMPSLSSVPHVPNITHKPSVWTRAQNFFRWPFNDSKQPNTKPQLVPNPPQPPFVAPYILPPPPVPMAIRYTKDPSIDMTKLVVNFVTGTVPRQVYLHFLLRLPSLYFSRVARIFEEADLTLPEIKKMALETASTAKGPVDLQIFESSNMPLPYTRLKSTWEGFIDSVMREWKTFNIISVLLLSAILTILQIDSAADDPITRYTAIASLICALISLLFGCMYIIRFGSMRKTYKAAEWALEAKKTKTVIWWNVWVLLAMPAIWLTWSIILYIACTMSFVWRTSSQSDSDPQVTSKTALLTVRIVISSVLGLGLIYGGLILTTFSRYGSVMDKAWKKRIDNWIVEKHGLQSQSGPYMPSQPSYYHTPYIRPGTISLPPGFAPEYHTPYAQQPGPLPPGFVPQTFAYPFQGSTPYATSTRLPPSGQYAPFIPPVNIPSYRPSAAPYTVPSYPPSPMMPPVIPPVSATPFIPPLDTPSSSPVESPYREFYMPDNVYSRQSGGPRRTNSGDSTEQNNPRRSSTNGWGYINEWDYGNPNSSTALGRPTSSSDMDSVTRTNTQHNAGPIPDHSGPSTSVPTDRPPIGSNPPSGRRRRTRRPVSPSSPSSLPTRMTSADANDTSLDVNSLSPLAAPASAHVHFRSPVDSESAARNQEGAGHTVRTVNADDNDNSSPIIPDSAQWFNVSSPQ